MLDYDDGGGAVLPNFIGDNKAIPFPDKWEVGQRVVWIRGDEYGYTYPGLTGVVVELSKECGERTGGEYQVFWCRPDGTPNGTSKYWTTPSDVRPISE